MPWFYKSIDWGVNYPDMRLLRYFSRCNNLEHHNTQISQHYSKKRKLKDDEVVFSN